MPSDPLPYATPARPAGRRTALIVVGTVVALLTAGLVGAFVTTRVATTPAIVLPPVAGAHTVTVAGGVWAKRLVTNETWPLRGGDDLSRH
jgi:hypothetical protein